MTATKRRPRSAASTIGFGFDPAGSPHHFLLRTVAPTGDVAVEECFAWGEGGDSDVDEKIPAATLKATLDAYRWARIAPAVAGAFNARLRSAGLSTANWVAETPLVPHLGKELTLLVWAVEEADPTLLPSMIANWLGLAPEERWWLYTTVNATSGHPEHGRDRGWRKAIKIAFAENPTGAPPLALTDAVAAQPLARGRRRPRRAPDSLPLPEDASRQMELF